MTPPCAAAESLVDREHARATVLTALAVAGALLVHDADATAAAPKRAALLLVALATSALLRGERRRLPAAALAWLGFVAWMACTLTWGTSDGRADLIGWVAASALLLATLDLPVASVRAATRIVASLVGAGASGWAAIEWLRGARGAWITGGQGNPDWLGITVAAALPCSLDWVRQRSGRRWALILVELVGLTCARSRTAWVAAAVALLVMVMCLPRRGVAATCKHRHRLALVATAAGAGALILAFVFGGAWPALVGRAWIWRWSWAVGAHHLPAGCGLGSFGTAFAVEQAAALRGLSLAVAERRFVHTPSAHDDWLQALAEGGLPALALLATTMLLGLHAHWRSGWRSGTATVLAICVAALAESPLRQPAVLALLALVLSACPSAPGKSESRPRARVAGAARSAVTLVMAAGALACAVPWWWAERLTTQARRTDASSRVLLTARASALDPGSPSVGFEQGLAMLALGDARAAIPCFERARRARWQVAYDLALGNAWLLAGESTSAAASYQHALALAPGSVRARLALAEARRREGRRDEAERLLEEARHQRPGGAAVRWLAARLAGEESEE